MKGKARKRWHPNGIALGFLVALVLSTATIIYTGLKVTALSGGEGPGAGDRETAAGAGGSAQSPARNDSGQTEARRPAGGGEDEARDDEARDDEARDDEARDDEARDDEARDDGTQ